MINRFQYYNPNPSGARTGDCVVRALCKSTGKDWITVYDELCQIGRELYQMPNTLETYIHYLEKHGFQKIIVSNKKGSRRPTVNDIASMSEDGNTYVCRVAHHVVTCQNGQYHDIFDSGPKSLYSYWVKK